MLFVCGEREMLLRKSFCIQETGVLEESAGLFCSCASVLVVKLHKNFDKTLDYS